MEKMKDIPPVVENKGEKPYLVQRLGRDLHIYLDVLLRGAVLLALPFIGPDFQHKQNQQMQYVIQDNSGSSLICPDKMSLEECIIKYIK